MFWLGIGIALGVVALVIGLVMIAGTAIDAYMEA